ncbi:NUDIX hydrolase [Algicella marina]|uniref:NUDIX hydrolase n=1 Tax=Algicella marina TaxID=2683284 RepID=A0A6P1T2G7_9RHOB|nr:NUDIX hydrolase [Algicella marina]QHQ37124.1 NUDIX hydrolase [Algicella marina]
MLRRLYASAPLRPQVGTTNTANLALPPSLDIVMAMGKKHKVKDRRALKEGKYKRRRQQVCALCYRRSPKKGLQFLLVTSRRTRRWIAPKGWPMKRLTNAEAAAQEAREEAGVAGDISERSIGFFSYLKYLENGKSIRLTVQVFPMEVSTNLRSYPEKGQRRRNWVKPRKAAKLATPPELGKMIREFAAYLEDEAKDLSPDEAAQKIDGSL